MKKFLFALHALVLVFCLSSCVREVEDIFDHSAAERIQIAMDEFRDILTSAENGWAVEYFGAPHSLSYGGYTLLFRFNQDSTVVAASEQYIAPMDSARSHFKLEQSAGIILSFDEYNKIIHYFSDPINPDGLGDTGEGFAGDFEFRIMSADKDEIVMKGKKHGARIVMTPLKKDVNWLDYLKNIKNVESEMVYSSYKLYMLGDTISVTPQNRSFIFRYTEPGDTAEQTKQICFIVTEKGLRLYDTFVYKSDSITSDSLTGFLFEENKDMYHSFESESTILAPELPSLVEQFLNVDNSWWIAYSNLGTFGQECWDKVQAAIDEMDPKKEVMSSACLKTKSNKFSLYFKCKMAGYLYISTKQLGDDRILMTYNGGDKNGLAYYKDGFNWAIEPFASEEGRTFTLETDRLKKPSYIVLRDENNPDNVIKVTALKTDYPFNK